MQINTPFIDKEQEYNSQSRLNGKTNQQNNPCEGDRKLSFLLLILGGIEVVICIVVALIYFL